MATSIILQDQLLATKFYVPIAPGTLISRPRLNVLVEKSLEYPLTLISAPAGFGKTTLLSAWTQSLSDSHPLVAWVSLDEEDNEPRLFWTYVLTALNRQQPERFSSLLMQLQSPQAPSLKYLLTAFINQLVDETDQFLLILDDYQLITEQQVHTTLLYLVEHLPTQLHIILSTRADPPLPLSQLRAHGQMVEVRTEQLRCTSEETRAFFREVVGTQLPDKTIQEVTARTEGWLVGLQLLGLSLPEQADPLTLLKETSGDQRYILDYLTEEVLRRQPQDVQAFLLSTCILERFSASVCDAILEQSGSQQMLRRLEQANLFVVSLDSKREWYRYHALFAEALRYRLKRIQTDLVPVLHYRASLWYAEHNQITQAILHAFHAREWQWAADLIEQKSALIFSFTWGPDQHTLVMLREWLKQLPTDIVHSRPRLCLACAQLLCQVTPQTTLDAWFDTAETTLTALLTSQTQKDASLPILPSSELQDQENLLGEVIAFRAILLGFQEEGESILPPCQRALELLSADNFPVRAQVAYAQFQAYYNSSANNAVTAIQTGLQGASLAQAAEQTGFAIFIMAILTMCLTETGQLHEAQRLSQQAMRLGRKPDGLILPEVGYPTLFQAEILREQNELDAALSLVKDTFPLCEQAESLVSIALLLYGYAVLLRIHLSRGELEEARSALEQFETIGMNMHRPIYIVVRSHYTIIDQIRFWIACGELDRAARWAKDLKVTEQHAVPFAREREEVAYARVLLAQNQPSIALQQLLSVLQRATAGQRWGHVIEVRLQQSLAYQMCQQQTQALDTLLEAIRLAEPEGYIRSFVDEGAPMEALLYQLRKQDRKHGLTPYLDKVLAAFQQEHMKCTQARTPTKVQPLPEPLSERELQVLQLLARGESNQEIAQDLVIAIDTVKRHVRHILFKLGVQNRFHAVKQAQELGLLSEEV